MKNRSIIILALPALVFFPVMLYYFFYFGPKKSTVDLKYDVTSLQKKLPPIDQGAGCPDGRCPRVTSELYNYYLKVTRRDCCIIKKSEVSQDCIDLNDSVNVNVTLLNISHINRCPCKIRILTSDHFNVPSNEEYQIFFLDSKKELTLPVTNLTAKKYGDAYISIQNVSSQVLEKQKDTHKISIHKIYGISKGLKDTIIFIGGSVVTIITIFMSAMFFAYKKIIFLRVPKRVSKKKTISRLYKKNIIFNIPQKDFIENLLNENNEWRNKTNAVFYVYYYSDYYCKSRKINKLNTLGEVKLNEYISLYEDTAVYFKVIISDYSDFEQILDSAQYNDIFEKHFENKVAPFFIQCTYINNEVSIKIVQDMEILLKRSKNIDQLRKEILRRMD